MPGCRLQLSSSPSGDAELAPPVHESALVSAAAHQGGAAAGQTGGLGNIWGTLVYFFLSDSANSQYTGWYAVQLIFLQKKKTTSK